MRHQHDSIDFEDAFKFWLSKMPLKHDLEEAKEANDFLADALTDRPELVVGDNGENVEFLIQF